MNILQNKKNKNLIISLSIFLILIYFILCFILSNSTLPLGVTNTNVIAQTFAMFCILTAYIICIPVILSLIFLIGFGIYSLVKKQFNKSFWKKYCIAFSIISILFYITYPFAIISLPFKFQDRYMYAAHLSNFKLFKVFFYRTQISSLYYNIITDLDEQLIYKYKNVTKDINNLIESEEFACSYYKYEYCDSLALTYLYTKNYDKLDLLSKNYTNPDKSPKNMKNIIEKYNIIGYLVRKNYQEALDRINILNDSDLNDLKTIAYNGLKQYKKALEIWNPILYEVEKNGKGYCYVYQYRGNIYNSMNNKKKEMQELEKFKKCSRYNQETTYKDFILSYDGWVKQVLAHQRKIENAIKRNQNKNKIKNQK